MKVRAKINLYENYQVIQKGEIFETTPERVKALGDSVEILEKAKSVERPKKDKMVHKAKQEKGTGYVKIR